MMEYTEKRNGKNVIPLRNAVCGIDLPKWCIHKESDIQSFLSGEAVDRLADLEDKIEQGTLIELPCKVGDTLWVVDTAPYTMKVRKATITKMCVNLLSDGKTDTAYFLRWYYNKSVYIENFYHESEFGKYVFLTREEAEKRLKEIQE